jgi:glycosyltransferase involved in cell wall biosynthesis
LEALRCVQSSEDVLYARDGRPVLWGDNARFLQVVAPALTELSSEFDYTLRIVSPIGVSLKDTRVIDSLQCKVKHIEWSPKAVCDGISRASIGICPLFQDAWCRVKAANKAATMAWYGLPVVATEIPAYQTFIREQAGKQTGFLCYGPNDWYSPLHKLMSNPALRFSIGERVKKKVRKMFSPSAIADEWEIVLYKRMGYNNE